MHYIGMAFRLPVPVAYDWPTVTFSLGAAIVASALALHTLSRKAMGSDQQEDQRFGVSQPADLLPDDLASAQKRLQRLQQAKTELEQEAREHVPLPAFAAFPSSEWQEQNAWLTFQGNETAPLYPSLHPVF